LRARLLLERARFVGWVERNETHQWPPVTVMGFASLYPSYEGDFCLRASMRAQTARSKLLQR